MVKAFLATRLQRQSLLYYLQTRDCWLTHGLRPTTKSPDPRKRKKLV